jgi:C2 domain
LVAAVCSCVGTPMPSSVRVRVVEARDLPEMDHNLVKSESFTDAYVDVRFRHHENRTQVCANLYPVVLSVICAR